MKKPGREYVDPTPVEWPLGVSVPESLEQKIARMVRTSVSLYAAEAGAESFEEADDFDIGDEEALPPTSHELDDDQERIMADQAAVRRIPPQFRAAFEREIERRRAAAQHDLEKTPPVPPVDSSPKKADSSPT